jgi:hypothetical protein
LILFNFLISTKLVYFLSVIHYQFLHYAGINAPEKGISAPGNCNERLINGIVNTKNRNERLKKGTVAPESHIASPKNDIASPKNDIASWENDIASPQNSIVSSGNGIASRRNHNASAKNGIAASLYGLADDATYRMLSLCLLNNFFFT